MREQTFQLTEEQVADAVAQLLLKQNRVLGLPRSGWIKVRLWRERDKFVAQVYDPLQAQSS